MNDQDILKEKALQAIEIDIRNRSQRRIKYDTVSLETEEMVEGYMSLYLEGWSEETNKYAISQLEDYPKDPDEKMSPFGLFEIFLELNRKTIIKILQEEERFSFFAKHSVNPAERRFYRIALRILKENIDFAGVDNFRILCHEDSSTLLGKIALRMAAKRVEESGIGYRNIYFPALRTLHKMLDRIDFRLSSLETEDPDARKQEKRSIAVSIWKEVDCDPLLEFLVNMERSEQELNIFSAAVGIEGIFEGTINGMKEIRDREKGRCCLGCYDLLMDDQMKIFTDKADEMEAAGNEKIEVLLRIMETYADNLRYP